MFFASAFVRGFNLDSATQLASALCAACGYAAFTMYERAVAAEKQLAALLTASHSRTAIRHLCHQGLLLVLVLSRRSLRLLQAQKGNVAAHTAATVGVAACRHTC